MQPKSISRHLEQRKRFRWQHFTRTPIVIHADCSRRGSFYLRFLCAYLFFRTISQKANAARINKFDIEMFQDGSRKSIYFGVQKPKVKITSHKNITSMSLCTLVSAGFFYLNIRMSLIRRRIPLFDVPDPTMDVWRVSDSAQFNP